jgi:hypothetical protein
MTTQANQPHQIEEIVQPMDRDSSPWADMSEMFIGVTPMPPSATVQPMERDSSPFSELGEDFLNAAEARAEQNQRQH